MLRQFIIAFTVLLPAIIAGAGVVEYQTEDRDQWFADVGGAANVSIVDFTGFDDFTPITDQWAHLGAHFSGFVVTIGPDPVGLPNDGWGVRGEPDINLAFDQPMQWIAADFPGATTIKLYRDDQLLFTSGLLGGGGPGHFGGLYSDEPFDRVRFADPFGAHADFLDDLFFGPPIPAPGVFALFGVALISRRRRSRVS